MTLEQQKLSEPRVDWRRTARRRGLSESTVGRIWRWFDLKPHSTDGFKLSTDPLLAVKVVDVVGPCHNPREKAVVLCGDEKAEEILNSLAEYLSKISGGEH